MLALSFALEAAAELVTWVSRFGAASAVAALALYGTLQAVDGVANKQADAAWLRAPSAEKTARFANAEAIRWVEWGLRSYQDYAVGLALLLFAAALVRTALPRPIAILMGLAGLAFLAQGWVVGVDGFSGTESITIVIGWALNLGWMTWLLVASSRMRYSGVPWPGGMKSGPPRCHGTERPLQRGCPRRTRPSATAPPRSAPSSRRRGARGCGSGTSTRPAGRPASTRCERAPTAGS